MTNPKNRDAGERLTTCSDALLAKMAHTVQVAIPGGSHGNAGVDPLTVEAIGDFCGGHPVENGRTRSKVPG